MRWSRFSSIGATLAVFASIAGCPRHRLEDFGPAPSAGGEVPATERSVVSIPFRLELGTALAAADSFVPSIGDYPGLDPGAGPPDARDQWLSVNADPLVQVRWRASRTPLVIGFDGARASIRTELSYGVRARAWVDLPFPFDGEFLNDSCGCAGEPWCNRDSDVPHNNGRRRVSVDISSPIGFSPAWAVMSHFAVTTTPLDACTLDPGDLAGRRDFTDRALGVIVGALGEAAVNLDRFVAANGDFHQQAEDAWRALSEPIPLGPNLWLLVQPETATASAISGSGSSVAFSVGVTATPTVIDAGRPSASDATLPPLEAAAHPDAGFHVAVPIHVRLSALNERLRADMRGRRYEFDGHSVELQDIVLWGSGGRIYARVDVDGDFYARVVARGVVEYDELRRELRVTGFDYTVASNILIETADWFAHAGVREDVARSLVWPIGGAVDEVSSNLAGALNRELAPGVSLTGSVAALRVAYVTVDADGLRAEVVADGDVAMSVIAR